MQKKEWTWIVFFVLLLADTAYTFLQHRMVGLDGDMPSLIVPAPHYEAILSEPFGWAAATGQASYASPNRFFVHQAMYHYYREVTDGIGRFTDPVRGIFLSTAFMKTGAHLLLLLLLSWFSSLRAGRNAELLAAVLIAPLFQSAGYYNPIMGLIEPAPTYTFFYAWPSVLLLLWLALLQRQLNRQASAPPFWEVVSLYMLTLLLPFTGPLVPGIICVGLAVGVSSKVIPFFKIQNSNPRAKLPLIFQIAIGLLGVLGLYSLYLGTLSTEQQESVGIWARYERLPVGIWKILTNKPGLTILLLGILLQVGLLRRIDKAALQKWMGNTVRYLLLFALLYILLIPLGGYRDYRPDIIRRDTLQPVLLVLFYLWGRASLLVIQAAGRRLWCVLPMVAILVLFTVADITDVQQTPCQEEVLRSMARSSKDTIQVSPDCRVLTWAENPDQATRLSSELLVLWGVLEEGQYFEYSGD